MPMWGEFTNYSFPYDIKKIVPSITKYCTNLSGENNILM